MEEQNMERQNMDYSSEADTILLDEDEKVRKENLLPTKHVVNLLCWTDMHVLSVVKM